jgi:hypothetical protein
MPKLTQTLDLHHALVLNLSGKRIQPFENRDLALTVLIKDNERPGQTSLLTSNTMFSYLRIVVKKGCRERFAVMTPDPFGQSKMN